MDESGVGAAPGQAVEVAAGQRGGAQNQSAQVAGPDAPGAGWVRVIRRPHTFSDYDEHRL